MSWMTCDDVIIGTRMLMKIWTQDNDDRPKIEIRLQDPIHFTDKVRYHIMTSHSLL
jgi:hypothetical protein